MKLRFKFLVMCLIISVSTLASTEVKIVGLLKSQQGFLTDFEDFVEDHNKPTLYAMKKALERVLVKIKSEEFGLVHGQTRREFQKYIMLADSPSYFMRTFVIAKKEKIEEFQENTQEIKETLGLDSPLGSVTVATYNQILTLLRQLKKHPVGRELQAILNRETLIQIAELLSTTEGRDTLPMLEAGERMGYAIRDLYKEFERLEFLQSKEAFHIALEVQGLNEFYMAYVIREQANY